MTLRFSDGVTVDTSGPLRAVHRSDGWYVLGEGYLLPMRDEKEARGMLETLWVKKPGVPPNENIPKWRRP